MSTYDSIRNYIMSLIGTQTVIKDPKVQIKSSTATATQPPSK